MLAVRFTVGDASAAMAVSGKAAKVKAAIHAQLDAVAFAHTGFFTSEPAEALATRLAELAPGDLSRVYLVSGGSEAVEAAIKMARQYFLEIGQSQRRHVVARWQSYHGNTLGALSAGGNRWRRGMFEPLLVEMSHISPCYEYRLREADESEDAYSIRMADELEAEILRLGPDTVAAFIAEPVVGATMGVVPATKGYFRRIREICDRYGVLLILDEVMCGMGRTGTLFACEQDGIVPDILTIAKGVGAGYQPIGAAICTSEIYGAFVDGSGFFQHGHTYMGHPVAAAAAGAVLERLVDDGLAAEVAGKGEKLREALVSRLGQHPNIGDIRGRGLFIGLELVMDRETKAPFAPEIGLNARVKKHAFEAGLICYPGSGTIDGKSGDHILLAPPFIVSDAEIALIVERLSAAIEAGLP